MATAYNIFLHSSEWLIEKFFSSQDLTQIDILQM